MAVNKTKDKDKGFKRIVGQTKKLKGSLVTIGVHPGAGDYIKESGDSISVGFVAAINEFGTDRIPERSFIRSTYDENKEKWRKITRDVLKKVIKGKMSTEKALDFLGFDIANKIKGKILKLREPGNAPATIKRKGADNPLVESRKLWGSITHEVKM